MEKHTQFMLLLFICVVALISSTSGASSSKSGGIHNSICDPKKPNACDDTQIARQNNYKSYLTCSEVSKKCVCKNNAHYDSEFDVCRIKAETRCPPTTDAGGFKQVCTNNAVCVYLMDKNGKPVETTAHGICECTYGYATTPELTCSSTGSYQGSKASNSYLAIFIGVLIPWIAFN